MKQAEIKVIVMEVGGTPEVKTIKNEYESLKQLVDGYIEFISLTNKGPLAKYSIMINEEGKLIPLRPNFHLGSDVVFGTAVIIGCDEEGDSIGVEDQYIPFLSDWLNSLPKCSGNENPEHYMGFSFISM